MAFPAREKQFQQNSVEVVALKHHRTQPGVGLAAKLLCLLDAHECWRVADQVLMHGVDRPRIELVEIGILGRERPPMHGGICSGQRDNAHCYEVAQT
jgi:hypothetical protein